MRHILYFFYFHGTITISTICDDVPFKEDISQIFMRGNISEIVRQKIATSINHKFVLLLPLMADLSQA